MAAEPVFASTPREVHAQVSTANTNRDGTGTIASIITGVAAGTKVEEIVVKGVGTTTAGMVRLYLSTDGGTTWRLYDEVVVTAITVGASTAAFRAQNRYDNLILRDASAQLGASTHNAETFNVFATGGDLT